MATSKAGRSKDTLESSLENLSIQSSKSKAHDRSKPVTESWEDSIEHDSSEEDADGASTPKASPRRPKTSDYPGPPPPTPSSPQFVTHDFSGFNDIAREETKSPNERLSSKHEARPDKTTSTASRMIASGLGVKQPPQSEEQKEYDKAMRDKARKSREAEKDEKKKAEDSRLNAKQAMWES